MLRKILFLLFLIFLISHFVISNSANAVHDPLSVPNNRFGIHILETQELQKAAALVNSGGGDWGYVTIPIRANDRDLPKWTLFMTDCSRLHLIPILRIASFPVDDHWMAPNEYDLIDFANFLDQLPWPTKNRYVVIYNEPNHKTEWGGFVYPEEYARVLDRAIDIFHRKNPDFFIISAALDSSSPDSDESMNEYSYMFAMNARIPGIFGKVDAFSSHSYGNPAFKAFPNIYSRTNIANYRYELQYLTSHLNTRPPQVFLTEAGWDIDAVGDSAAGNFYTQGFQRIWTDDNIVAITPFVLSAQAGPFKQFSWTDGNGNFRSFAMLLQNTSKIAGKPVLVSPISGTKPPVNPPQNSNLPDASGSSDLWTAFQKLLQFLHLGGV